MSRRREILFLLWVIGASPAPESIANDTNVAAQTPTTRGTAPKPDATPDPEWPSDVMIFPSPADGMPAPPEGIPLDPAERPQPIEESAPPAPLAPRPMPATSPETPEKSPPQEPDEISPPEPVTAPPATKPAPQGPMFVPDPIEPPYSPMPGAALPAGVGRVRLARQYRLFQPIVRGIRAEVPGPCPRKSFATFI